MEILYEQDLKRKRKTKWDMIATTRQKILLCYVTAQQEQERARSTENVEPNEGSSNESGNVWGAWGLIVTLLLGLHTHEGKTQ